MMLELRSFVLVVGKDNPTYLEYFDAQYHPAGRVACLSVGALALAWRQYSLPLYGAEPKYFLFCYMTGRQDDD